MRLILLLSLLSIVTSCGFEIVDTGRRGVQTSMGQIVGEPLPEGVHFYNPFTSDIVEINVREQAYVYDVSTYSRDNQTIQIEVTVVASPVSNQVHTIYKNYGSDFFETIASKEIIGGVKEIVGQYTSSDIISKRAQLRKETENYLKEKLSTRHINITGVDFTGITFDDAFERAVQAKVVAIQHAEAAKNKTVQIREEKDQAILQAQGQAEAMRIKSNALSQNKSLVEYEAVQKWDGKLPVTMMGNSTPFINLGRK